MHVLLSFEKHILHMERMKALHLELGWFLMILTLYGAHEQAS